MASARKLVTAEREALARDNEGAARQRGLGAGQREQADIADRVRKSEEDR